MVQIIAGGKGKGKTKYLLDMANKAITEAHGTIVYLDKNSKHMFELNNKVRLIDVPDFMIENEDEFIGFVSGIISQDHDLQQMYLDSFLKIASLEGKDITTAINRLEKLSDKFGVDFILSVSLDEHELPEDIKPKVHIAL